MGTNLRMDESVQGRGKYKHHPVSFKRAVVEETLRPGASVARIARAHGVNANQVFAWRKLFREGALGDDGPMLLPVTVEQGAGPVVESVAGGAIIIEAGRLLVRVEGRPDSEALRIVLAELRRT